MYPYKDLLLQLLDEAISAVDGPYFNLPVALADPIERERNYCAELFHQLRQREHILPYSVTAEPNKKRHPVIEQHCGPIDPDLVIHHPGEFGAQDNLAVIEVKSSSGNLNAGIKKDISTINCMTNLENGYRFGVFIVFGEITERRKNNLIDRIQNTRSENGKEYFLFLQQTAGSPPDIFEIDAIA